MEIILIIIGVGFIIAGLIGSLLPVLPGPPLSYVGLALLELATGVFSLQFLIIWAIIVAVVIALDYFIPTLGTKKFGGSPYGVWGSAIGLIIGIFFFPPFGMIIGPLIGAFVGELVAGKTSDRAIKSVLGSFLGLLAGTIIKLIACGVMGFYFFANL